MDLLFRAKRAYEHSQQNKKILKSDFRSNHAFEKRVNESKRIIEKYTFLTTKRFIYTIKN